MTQTRSPEDWMRDALALAKSAVTAEEVPVGAIIVRENEIIASAHNETEQSKDPTAHAETLAIRRAAQKLDRWRLDDCSLYVTLEPCPMCIGAILLARIPRLYFGCYDPKLGAVGSLFDLSAHSSLPTKIEVFPSLLEHDCRDVLQGFFRSKRD